MNKGKYFKLKPSDAAHLKLDIKNFVIEHINLFAIKKEMEIIAKINNYDALNEIEDLREVINKKFDNEINLKIKLQNMLMIRRRIFDTSYKIRTITK